MDVYVTYTDLGRVTLIFSYTKLEHRLGEPSSYLARSEYFSILIRDISIFVVSIFAFEKVFVIEIKNFHTDKHTFMYD